MSIENNRDKDLPNQSTEVVGSKPDANERILSAGSRSKTGRKERPHVDHETSDEEDSFHRQIIDSSMIQLFILI